MQGFKFDWEKIGWINIAETVSSFPWPGLPADAHFSFSYSPNSEMMNLHLTRNVSGVLPENKPQIRIAQWPKGEWEEMTKIFFYRYWQLMWLPFDMRKYQYRRSTNGQDARYCSIPSQLKVGKEHPIYRQLKKQLLQHTKRKKKGRHLMLGQGFIPQLEKWALRPSNFWPLLNQFKRVPRNFSSPTEIGYIYARDFSGIVLLIQGNWFTYNTLADLSLVFQAFFETEVYEDLREKVAKAIIDIAGATTKADTVFLSQPIDLAIVR